MNPLSPTVSKITARKVLVFVTVTVERQPVGWDASPLGRSNWGMKCE